jgi:DNA polymerase-3 subunit delta'
MTDVFDSLVGQERAAGVLRQYARHPVHAYLFCGPPGTSVRDALFAFAASLQCPAFGCGTCEMCRRVLDGRDADVYVAERAGVSWRMEEIREAERVSRRRPLGAGYQIVILDDVELTTTSAAPSAAALLKSLEEPPTRTIFLLSAQDVPEELGTIVSRCVEVRLRALGENDIATILVHDGASAEMARDAARASNGNLRRARVLVRDRGLGDRLAQWRSVPERLSGKPADSTRAAKELARAIDDAMAPLEQMQNEEWTRRSEDARQMGLRAGSKRDVESQFKREQRRFRQDELRFGLNALTGAYRERLRENVAQSDARSDYRVGASLRALDAIAEAHRRLETNLDENLLLNDLMLSLMEF